MKTNDELYQLAKDYTDGKVFSNLHIKEGDERLLFIIFSPIYLMSDNLTDGTFSLVYEYISKSGNRSINGYPTFTSCKFLKKDEFEIFVEYHNKIIDQNTAMKEGVLSDKNN